MSQTTTETVTAQDLLDRVNDAIDALQQAQQTVTGGAAQLGNAVHRTGEETIAGVKTFIENPLVPTPSVDDNSSKAANMAVLQLLKALLLPKTGGEITGDTWIKSDNLSLDATPDAITNGKRFDFKDANGVTFAGLYGRQMSDAVNRLMLLAYGKHEGTLKTSALQVCINKNTGATYVELPTPGPDDPNGAAQTKASVARDYLAKSGGEITGNITQIMTSPRIFQKLSGTSKNAAPTTRSTGSYSVYTEDANQIGSFSIDYNIDQARSAFMQAVNADASASSRISAIIEADGTTYATCPPPRPDNYANDIVNTKALKDWAAKKLTKTENTYVGGANASDTADLWDGRGSADKPFAALDAAIKWVNSTISGPNEISLVLQDDVVLPTSITICCPQLARLSIKSDSTRRKLKLGAQGISIIGGVVIFDGVDLEAPAAGCDKFVWAAGTYGNPVAKFNNCGFFGTATFAVLSATWGGKILVQGTITGEAIGKRYYATGGSCIITGGQGPDYIPGTIDGTCDASSVYA